jgi:hypothetical protein
LVTERFSHSQTFALAVSKELTHVLAQQDRDRFVYARIDVGWSVARRGDG